MNGKRLAKTPRKHLTTMICLSFLTFVPKPQKPAQVNLEDIITRYGNHFPNQQPPLWRIHNRQMHLIVRYVRLRNIPCMLVRSSSCSLTTRCCPLSAQAMYVSIVSNQVTSQRIVEATIVARNARSHITRCFTVSLPKTKNSQSLPLPNLLL